MSTSAYWTRIHTSTHPRERSNRRLWLLGSIGTIVELFDQKNLNAEPSSFYNAGSDQILGNDKGVGVPVFTNRKIKNTKKQNTPEWHWVKGQHHYYISVGIAYVRFSPCHYVPQSDQKQFSLNINKSKYTSVLLEGHFLSGNTAFPLTRPHALSNVIIHK